MNAPLLTEEFNLLAAAPKGVQKLRELILSLAVRGRLVPQEPSDEPATEVLKRIAVEHARLEAKGICKKSRAVLPIVSREQPFDPPIGWVWVRLGQIGHDWGQKTPDTAFTYIDVSAIDNVHGRIDSCNVLAAEDAPSRARKLVRQGSVIYSTVRPYLLNIAVVGHDFTPEPIASTAFAILHPLAGVSSQFIYWYLRSPVFVAYVESVQTGIAYPAVNDAQFFSGLFPLPPLAEQYRIVAKVDELMALCDQLEAQQTKQTEAHERLVATLLDTLTQSADAAAFADNWARIAEHFDLLFNTQDSIGKLKQSILQLAVQGKLIPQDPRDETASNLLKQVAIERVRLESEGICKKSKPVPPASRGDEPFALPQSWCWVRLGDLCSKITDGEHATPRRSSSGHYLLSARNVTNEGILLNDVDFVPTEEFVRIRKRCDPSVGDVLISCSGSVGRVAIVDRDNAYSMVRSAAMVRPIPIGITPNFAAQCLRSPVVQREMVSKSRQSAQANLFLGAISSLLVPLPPLAEQHRIVAKVDELMAVCDALTAGLVAARELSSKLVAAAAEAALA